MMDFRRTGEITSELAAKAKVLAVARESESRESGRKETTWSGGKSGSFDLEGAIGEYVVADVFDLPEPVINTFKHTPDVGPFEVAAVTRHQGDYRKTSLIIRPSDLEQGAGDRPYILVVIGNGKYSLKGWMIGHEGPGLGREFGKGGRICWMVPIDKLNDFDDFFWNALETWKKENL